MAQTNRPDAWNPRQYGRFHAERSQPFYDLLDLVRARPGMRVVDVGCGTGQLTAEMHRRLEARETIGVDSSAAMVAEAAANAGGGFRVVHSDLRAFAEQPENQGAFDLVLSNAALQWVPEQAAVIVRLVGLLARGGQIAIQVPSNEDHASHQLARDLAGTEPFRTALDGYVRRHSNLALDEYAELLDRLGFAEQHVRQQVYVHHLPGREDVVEWVRGTMLTDYQRRMPPELFDEFLTRYRAGLMPKLSEVRPFLYPFKRILVWGSR